MAQTFDSSQLPSSLPQMPTSKPSPQQSVGGGLNGDIIERIHQKAAERNKDIYERYFGRSFGTGKVTTERSFGGGLLGGKRTAGIKTVMNAFRRDPSGAGRNLNKKDIEYIGGKIVETLKKSPTIKSYDSKDEGLAKRKKKKLFAEFKGDIKKGKISKSDFQDAKEIIKHIKI